MHYSYVRSIQFGQCWVDTLPLSVNFLSNGLFDPAYLQSIPASAGQHCAVPELGDPVGVGPDAGAPFESLDDLESGRKPPDAVSRRLQALEQQWRRQQERQRSRWQGNKSGPPPRPLPPMSRPYMLPPIGRGGAGRAGAAALVATIAIAAHRHSLIAELRHKLNGLNATFRSVRAKSAFRQVLCSAVYSFYTFTDDIGDNRPALASLSVLSPPDMRGGKSGIKSAYDQFDFLLRPKPPPGQHAVSAAPFKQLTFGDMKKHYAPNRAQAVGYIFASG